ncbi:hypothetical protein PVAP13_3KG538801 [Panicum virgatum]|uniref:Uncharacterized protein n=1 Tax=Panicum virgatum TaxID=38727 RepID=A0A8T0VBD8_PANVG|nr:hypothetical protein PVAP13_3KG538801 [Panicum virgatum]
MEKEDALLHMLGEINKSLQASLKSGEPLQVPEGTSPEEIFEALRGIPRLACADLLRAYSMLIRDDRRYKISYGTPQKHEEGMAAHGNWKHMRLIETECQ